MNSKKTLGEKLAILSKSQGKTQSGIAEAIDMAPSQLNRFFKGHAELSLPNFISVLSELGIDLDEIISNKTKKHADMDENKIDSVYDCITYMYKNIDDLGKQTYLAQLLWATKLSVGESFPKKIEEQIKREITLI